MDQESKVVYLNTKQAGGDSTKHRWALGLGVAACAALGFMGYQSFSNDTQSEGIVLNSDKASEQLAGQMEQARGANATVASDAVVAPAAMQSAQAPIASADEEMLTKPAMTNQVERKGATAKTTPKPVKPGALMHEMKSRVQITEPSLDFGEGWGQGSGTGSGGAVAEFSKGKLKKQSAKADGVRNEVAELSKLRPSKPHKRIHPPKPSPIQAERYGELIENRFISPTTKDTKLSTFAVDVDTASYANLRRMIVANNKVPANAVRIEEMVNYFDYQYAQPKGEHPFAVHVDSATCPWNVDNKLVRIAIQGKDLMRDKRPASNIVFLLDVSGSMNNADKLPLLKESLKYLLEELNEKDTVSIVVYAGASGLALPPTQVNDEGRRAIIDSLGKLNAGGSTAGGQGIKLAYKLAKENFVKGGVNRVILATDGDFNVGVSSNKGLTDLIKKEAKGGSYLSVLGFGSGNINDDMLETITNNGNGNYSYIDSIKEGRKVLLEDMMGTLVTIAKDVKVRVEFNPEKVKEYRLVGYANRVLPNAAFLDKTADAGEIGAGHTVTAFYEIVPGKAADKTKLDNLRFEKQEDAPELEIPAEHADKLLFVDLAYKQPDQKINDESTYLTVPLIDADKAWEDADEDFKFASSVALFGMVLRDSDFRGDGDLDLVEKLATEGKGNDGKGHREEFLQLVKKAKARK